jgi:hypothetical protein
MPDQATLIGTTTGGRLVDPQPPTGVQHYALRVTSGQQWSSPVWTSIDVPAVPPPPAPSGLSAKALSGQIALAWEPGERGGLLYEVYRAKAGSQDFVKLNREPFPIPSYSDPTAEPGTAYAYMIRAIDRRGQQSDASLRVEAAALPEIEQPVFATDFTVAPAAELHDGTPLKGRLHGGAKIEGGALLLSDNGFATFEHRPEFDLGRAISVQCWVRFDEKTQMPVVLSCGVFPTPGWFLQQFGRGWRWQLGGVSCDGGQAEVGKWMHLVGTFDGQQARLYQDGRQVAVVDAAPSTASWDGPLMIGQYSRRAPSYQVLGRMTDVKIHARALKPDEVAEAAKVRPDH